MNVQGCHGKEVRTEQRVRVAKKVRDVVKSRVKEGDINKGPSLKDDVAH